jgi:alkylhydroperoxidase/carboxymuconolactone decarboxylase family protein YurZ
VSLPDADRRLCRLFAACVLGRWDELRTMRRNAHPGEPDRRWREALLMVHLFAGVPRAVEAYGVLEAAGGLGAPGASETGESPERDDRGVDLFGRIYGDGAAEVREMLARHHPLFGRWVLEHAYGRVLARDGLSAARRELLACAALAALGQDRQLASHARGAVRCGAQPREVESVLDAIEDLVPAERMEAARMVVRRFTTAALD